MDVLGENVNGEEQRRVGFQKFTRFNLALLGKQIWHFLNRPDSLVDKIFKARYYPENHLLKAQKGNDASFIWTWICEAKEELCKGFKWVLGDGRSINIFVDQWLRGKSDFMVENHHVNSSRNEKVSEYFRPDTKEWDVTKISQTFHEVDVRCILNTRIPQNQIQDRIAWMHTGDGKYAVKSGYHFSYGRTHNESPWSNAQGWSRLWKILIPHKMKIFLWRVCKNNIPVKVLLRGKGVQTSIIYPMCNVDVEHARHLFLECPFSRQCWAYIGGEYDVADVEILSTWALEKLSSESGTRLVNLAKTMWGIWFARNKQVWDGKQMTPKIAMDISSKMITDWQGAQQREHNHSPEANDVSQMSRIKWQPPEPDWYKVNVGASVIPGSPYFKVGMVLRNDKGEFVAGITKCMEGDVQVMEAEGAGVHEALGWVENMGIRNVVVECDSLSVVNVLLNNMAFFSEVGNTLVCCKDILRQRTDLKVQHVRRQANSVAHNMAKLPCLLGAVNSFIFPPPCVLELILCDTSS